MSFTNKAAWLPAKDAQLMVGPADVCQPGPAEVLIQNEAWAINPVDFKMQSFGFLIESYPAILGCDLAGTVVATGKKVIKFKVGDRIAAASWGIVKKKQAYQAFQLYTLMPIAGVVSIPDSLSFEEAVKLPLGILTAAAGLYEKSHLALPLPSLQPHCTDKTLLVWGGSSNVGSAAIQLARASGVEVVATASVHNFDTVRTAGAVEVFDYSSSTVVDDLMTFLEHRKVVGAYDVIGTPVTINTVAEVLSRLGGGNIVTTTPMSQQPTLPEGVNAKLVQALSVFTVEPEVGKAVWEGFLPQALLRGQIRPLLKTKVIGSGLESIQAGLDEVRKGASGTKIVISA